MCGGNDFITGYLIKQCCQYKLLEDHRKYETTLHENMHLPVTLDNKVDVNLQCNGASFFGRRHRLNAARAGGGPRIQLL